MKKYLITALFGVSTALLVGAADNPGIPRDSNFNNTGWYDGTQVHARINVKIDDDTEKIHFIRDNNDPRVVTKAYRLKNIDAYEFRDYLRQMVQAKRVGNTALQQIYPGNSTNPNIATLSSVEPTTPVTAQPTYNPDLQLGSNTAVECLKYVDGTGLLIISAEEYRFKDNENGWGFDRIVEFMDRPQMGANLGTQVFFYIPKFVPARNLLPLIQNVGMNIFDVTEIWQGQDLVAYDSDLNWLIFDTTNYSMANIEKMLKKYDVPIPQVKLKFDVYEVYSENDEKLGLDFQAWKNNDGMDFFSGGARFRDNWQAVYGGNLENNDWNRTAFYNFNPRWNTRYIDFLVSKGHAKITHSGEMSIRNNTPAEFSRITQIFYMDKSQAATSVVTAPDEGVGAYKFLSNIINSVASSSDFPVGKATIENTVKSVNYGFTMKVNNVSVNLLESSFDITLTNTSLIGFESNGTPRIAEDNSINLTVYLPHGSNKSVIGGLKKHEEVKSDSGIPFLKDIPVLGYLFSSKSTSIKSSDLIIVGECSYDGIIDSKPNLKGMTKSQTI
jgi:type II secretory pathway component GspD/PulD (secretin)